MTKLKLTAVPDDKPVKLTRSEAIGRQATSERVTLRLHNFLIPETIYLTKALVSNVAYFILVSSPLLENILWQ